MTQEFEGQEISEFIAALPGMKLEAPDSYQRGTYLTLSVEVRVRSVRYEEVTSGKNKGDLQKIHVLAIENVSVEETVTPQQHRAMLEAAAATLLDENGQVVQVPDGGPITEATPGSISEPVATVLPEPVDEPQMTPSTLTEAAADLEGDEQEAVARYDAALAGGLSDAEAREEGWVYEAPEYASTSNEVSVGF